MNPELWEANLSHGPIQFVDEGHGPALLLIHGLGGNWQNWQANLDGLARCYRVIAPDLPGFGRSEPYRGDVTMTRYADTIVEFLDVLGIEQITFVGNSMGGLLSIEAAVRPPPPIPPRPIPRRPTWPPRFPGALNSWGFKALAASQLIFGNRRPMANVGVSNVPGPQVPLYMNGARAERFFGVAPIFHGSALVFGVFSYCGLIEVTFVSCRRVVPDPESLAECVQASYDELLAKVQATEAISHRRRARA
jgi:hypothetical protein